MVDHPTSLDAHRGVAAQKAADLRRLRSEVEADQRRCTSDRRNLRICSRPLRHELARRSRRPAICWASSPKVQRRPIRAGVS